MLNSSYSLSEPYMTTIIKPRQKKTARLSYCVLNRFYNYIQITSSYKTGSNKRFRISSLFLHTSARYTIIFQARLNTPGMTPLYEYCNFWFLDIKGQMWFVELTFRSKVVLPSLRGLAARHVYEPRTAFEIQTYPRSEEFCEPPRPESKQGRSTGPCRPLERPLP